MIQKIRSDLREIVNPEKVQILQKFFKTGKGEYAEGDVFIGVTMPNIRKIAKKYYREISLNEIQDLLNSKIHEERMCALVMLVEKFKKAKKDGLERLKIFEMYLRNTHRINNWDLVDVTCHHIVGEFSKKEGTEILRRLAKSDNLWEKRIAIVSTYSFIRKNNFGETLAISDMLLKDEHDLIHKAVGWMLREVGKKNKKVLELFLMQRHKEMPRTMLRYAIEKFPEDERKKWMEK